MRNIKEFMAAALTGVVIASLACGCSSVGVLDEAELRTTIETNLSERYSQNFEIETLETENQVATGTAMSVSQGECNFTVNTSGTDFTDDYSAFIFGDEAKTIIQGIIDSHTGVSTEDVEILFRETSEVFANVDEYIDSGVILVKGTFANKDTSNENVDDLTGLINDLQTKGVGLKIEAYARNHKVNLEYDKMSGDELINTNEIWNKLQ